MMITYQTIDWPKIRQKVEQCDWARALADQLEQDYRAIHTAWPGDPPRAESAWAHYYYCPDCGTRLSFAFDEPNRHPCLTCGRVLTGEPYDGAWRKAVHGSVISNLERAAALAHLRDEAGEYAQAVRQGVLYYADHYLEYGLHGGHAGIGRVMPQSLTEAIFIIALERILRMVSDLSLFSEAEWAHIRADLFQPALELIRPQIDKIHNIHAWMISAVCACASVLGDDALLQEALFGELGWKQQLEQGVNEDGCWYELSPGYHFYAMRALVSGAWIAQEHGIPLFSEPKLRRMGPALYQLAYPNGQLPAYNDSGWEVYLYNEVPIFEEMSATDDSGIYENLLNFCYSNMAPKSGTVLNALVDYTAGPANGFARCSLSALLYGPAELRGSSLPPRDSVLFPHSGIALLRREELRVALKFSNDGGGHDHNDKLSLELSDGDERLCADTGTPGYALAFTNDWCRSPVAHNMVIIDGERQAPCDARLLDYSPAHVEAEAADAYKGVALRRRVELAEHGFEDRFSVACENERLVDYAFRCAGKAVCSLELASAEPYTEKNGYDQLLNVRRAESGQPFSVVWNTGTRRVALQVEGCPGSEIVVADCFGHDRTDPQMILLVRRRAASTVFHCSCRIERM